MNIEVIFEDNIIDVIDFGNVVLSTAGLSPDDVYTKTQTDTLLDTKQANLVSGTNIKSINNTSLLGSGNIDISGSGGTTDHNLLTNRDIANQHTISSITDLQIELDGKSATNHNHTLASLSEKSYNSLTDIPTTFTPSNHTQAISTIDNLQTELDSKQVTLVSGTNIKSINGTTLLGSGNIEIGGTGTTDHSMLTNRDIANQHPISSITGLETVLNEKADTDSVYTISAMNTLLNTKSDTSHNHNLNDLSEKSYNSLTDKPTLFSGSYNDLSNVPTEFTPTNHNHSIADITNLQTELNGKEPLKGADDNYVTDAQLIVISNTSGTNTGDQDLSGLQPKEIGKGLSTNDYTDAEKALVATIPDKADINHIHAISDVTGLQTALNTKSDTSHNHSLNSLTEKSYNSLTDKPTIPTDFNTLYYTKSEIDTKIGDIETLLGAI